VLVRADQLADDEVWAAHEDAKGALIEKVRDASGQTLDPDLPILAFARRMTGYKRPDLLFTDMKKLLEVHQRHPFQIVLGGKAHPHDRQGKALIQEIHEYARAYSNRIRIIFVPNYDMELASFLVSGADVWLNTPLPPLEASGTSGMKAAMNGVLNLSVLDGWWIEACVEGVTGWAVGIDGEMATGPSHAEDLYRKLRDVVLPLYYNDRPRWIWMMKESISKIAYYFNSQRMMRRYASEAYLR
jgi:starch phosphorylase